MIIYPRRVISNREVCILLLFLIKKKNRQVNTCLWRMIRIYKRRMMSMKKRAIIIINENHSMMDEQKSIIEERYYNYEFLKVPAQGWTLEEMNSIVEKISTMELKGEYLDIVFVSPVPYMIRELTRREILFLNEYAEQTNMFVRVFHNDVREKKELPDGRIISVVAQTGWQLV